VSPTFCDTVTSSESCLHVCTASFLILICKISPLYFLTSLVCVLSLIQIGSLNDACGTGDNHMRALLALCAADDQLCIWEGRVWILVVGLSHACALLKIAVLLWWLALCSVRGIQSPPPFWLLGLNLKDISSHGCMLSHFSFSFKMLKLCFVGMVMHYACWNYCDRYQS
jgi:hypothetical protein